MSQSRFENGAPNPYDAPQTTGGTAAAAGTRPATASVFGILNIVFGALGVVGIAATIIMWFVPLNPRVPNPALELMRDSNAYRTFMIVATGLGAVATVVLIVAGVGLWRLKPWGRTLSIAYAVYGIVSVIVGAVVNYMLLIGPLIENAQAMPPGPEKAGAIGGAVGGFFGTCFGFIYPALLLIFMLRLRLPDDQEGSR